MEKLKQTLDKFKDRKILVIGDIVLDKFTWGEIERINPEQPAAHVVKINKENYVLGGAANVANNISSLGANCCLYGVVGKDTYKKKIEELCEEKNINLKSFCIKNQTLVKQRVVAHGQQIVRLDFGEQKLKKIGKEIQDQIIDSLKQEIKDYDFIILSDYDKFLFDEILSKRIIDLANLNNVRTLVDPKPKNIDFFKNCTLISPNKHEAQEITKINYSAGKETLIKMGEKLSDRLNAEYVVITCGKDGMFSYHKGDCDFICTKAKEVSNVTGAGDTFAATLVLSLSSGLNIHDAAKLANYAAGIVVGKVGTAITTIEEIEEYLKD